MRTECAPQNSLARVAFSNPTRNFPIHSRDRHGISVTGDANGTVSRELGKSEYLFFVFAWTLFGRFFHPEESVCINLNFCDIEHFNVGKNIKTCPVNKRVAGSDGENISYHFNDSL